MAKRFTDYYRAKGSYSKPGQAAKQMAKAAGDKAENREVGTDEVVKHYAEMTPGQQDTNTSAMEKSPYPQTESVELDEISKDLARSYRSALSKKYDKVDRSNGVEISRSTDYGKDSKKRMAGKQRANAIINKESVELDELSKSTLANYATKAAFDAAHHGDEAGAARKMGDFKKSDKHFKKSVKRAQGVSNAARKLAYEAKDEEEKDRVASAARKPHMEIGPDGKPRVVMRPAHVKTIESVEENNVYFGTYNKRGDRDKGGISKDRKSMNKFWKDMAAKRDARMAAKKEEVDEKTLTKAELKKREEIAKAMERDNPGMPMDKKMAIATAQAKKVAESTGETNMSNEWDDERMDIIGQNGNDGIHYEVLEALDNDSADLTEKYKKIDELSKDTLMKYSDAATKDLMKAVHGDRSSNVYKVNKTSKSGKPLTMKGIRRRQNKKFDRRTSQSGAAYRKAQAMESVEQIDELSKNTLGKYINRATANNTVASHYGGSQERRASDAMDKGNYNVSNKAQASADRMYRKSQKRQKGIQKAVNRLTKEDTQLDELKARTIGSYIRKATNDLTRQKSGHASAVKHNKHQDEYSPRGASPGMKSMEREYAKRAKKREKGLAAADRALAKKESVEEAVTRQDVKQGIGIARDKRYAGGNMTGAVSAMDKLKKGLSSHPAVKKELQKQNEELTPSQKTNRLDMIRQASMRAQDKMAAKRKKAERDAKRAMKGDKVLGDRPMDD